MTKSLALLPRRADFTRAGFREYYETRHAPLAIGYFAFSKYVRNHLTDHDDIGFDTISEFWSEDIVKLAALMETGVGEIMRADERCFMDRSQIRSGASAETLLAGAPRGVEPAARAKRAWLLRRGDELDAAGFASAASELGCALAAASGEACERVTLDLITAWPGAPFPFDAVLWFWMRGAGAVPPCALRPGVVRWREVSVTSLESAPESMAAALKARATPSA